MRSMVLWSMWAATALGQTPPAAEPCGGPIAVSDGLVQTPMNLTGGPKEDGCVKAIAAQLAADPDVRALTVELRVPDDQRVGGKALKMVARVADVLAQGGFPKDRISHVVPRADAVEPGLKISVRMVPPPLPVVQLLEHSGVVLAGRDESRLEARRPGAGVSARERVVTREGSGVLLVPDVATLRLDGDSLLEVLAPGEGGVPPLALARGAAHVASIGPGFELALEGARLKVLPSSKVSVTTAQGLAQVMVYEGSAELEGKDAKAAIPAGHGLVIDAGKPREPKQLLPAPKVTSTFGKPLEGPLRWDPVPGASKYRIEVAPTAEFGAGTVTVVESAQQAQVGTGSGRWFFRVAALDDAGLAGKTSKVYSFTR